MGESAPAPARDHARAMWLIGTAAFAGTLSIRVCDPMLPSLGEAFGRSATDVSLTVTVFVMAYGLFSLVAGPLGDRRGKLAVMSVAALVAAAASLAAALPLSYGWLLAMRFVSGAAIGAVMPLGLAWIGDNVPYAERPATLANFTAAATTGGVVGQMTGGLFADTLGWNTAFLFPGLLFLVAGVMMRGPARRAPRPRAAPDGVVGVLRAYRAIFADRRACAVMLFVALEGAIGFGALAFIPSFLHLRHDIPLWQAGLIVGGFGLGGLLFAIFSRHTIARLGERGLALVGSAGLTTGLLAAVGSPVLAGAIAACLLTGFGFYMMHNTVQTRGTQLAPANRGIGLACMALALFSGQSAGVAAAAEVIDIVGYGATIAGMGVLAAVLGVVIAHWLRNHPPLRDL